jgi:hypothetical protein
MSNDAVSLLFCDCLTCQEKITRKIIKGLAARYSAHIRNDETMEAARSARYLKPTTNTHEEN